MSANTNDQSVTVSIVIPCFNHGQYIQETLDSIDAQKIFITLRSRVQIPVSLHENQGLTFNRGSFVVSA
jgi:glycosyltransferase involved in cell wall biosynthesis